jgi:hypothetical protein
VPSAFHISPIYEVLLRGSARLPVGISQLRLVTAEQLTRLHYSPGSIKAIKARLKRLADEGFVQADVRPTKRGHGCYYYALAEKGAKYLEAAGYPVEEGWKPSKEKDKHGMFVAHTLEVNDLVIAAALLGRAHPHLTLAGFIPERFMKRQPFKTTWRRPDLGPHHAERFTLIPDGYLDIRATTDEGMYRRPIVLEHDRGTEDQTYFRRRIRAYVIFMRTGEYRTFLGVKEALTIAFTTFEGEGRVARMREWTRAELKATREPDSLSLAFWFANLPPAPTPEAAWLEPRWLSAIDAQPAPLLTV